MRRQLYVLTGAVGSRSSSCIAQLAELLRSLHAQSCACTTKQLPAKGQRMLLVTCQVERSVMVVELGLVGWTAGGPVAHWIAVPAVCGCVHAEAGASGTDPDQQVAPLVNIKAGC